MPINLVFRLMRIASGRNTRRNNRRRECEAGSSDLTVLQFDVAIGGKEVAFLENHEMGAAGAIVVVVIVVWSAVTGVHVEVGYSLAAVAVRVC